MRAPFAAVATAAVAPLLLVALAPPAQATLAPHAVAAGPVSVTFVAEVIDVCVGTLGVAAVAVDGVTGAFSVDVVAALPACSYHNDGVGGCTFAPLTGDVRCTDASVVGYMEFTLTAAGEFHLTSMGPNSWTIFGSLVRA